MGMLVRDVLTLGVKRLSEAGIESSKYDAEELFCFMNGLERSRLFMEWAKELDDKSIEEYFDVLDVRAGGRPLQYITGHQEFMGFDFKVNESVLIPRQDTEVLVSEALAIIGGLENTGGALAEAESVRNIDEAILKGISGKGWKVLDLCTGSGAIGVSVAKLAQGANVTATDISNEALAVAEGNAKTLGAKVNFEQGDLFGAVKKRFGKATFDMIISNPPYIESEVIEGLSKEVRDYEPRLALDGGADGLDFYRRIIEEAPAHLNKDGWLLLEIGYNQAEEITAIAASITAPDKGAKKKKEAPAEIPVYTPARIVRDLAGLDRVVILRKQG